MSRQLSYTNFCIQLLFFLGWGIFALFSFVSLSAPAHAIDNHLFTISGIDVEARAASEVDAKTQAMNLAKRRGLDRLVTRLVIKTDGGGNILQNLPEDQLESLIRDISFQEEKFGGGVYFATVTIRFNADKIRQLFLQSQIRYSDTQGPNFLLIPVLKLGDQNYLWEVPNPWADAWRQTIADSDQASLVQFYVPPSSGVIPSILDLETIKFSLPPGTPEARRNLVNELIKDPIEGRMMDGILIANLTLSRFGTGEIAELSLFPDSPSWNDVVVPLRFASLISETRDQFLKRITDEAKAQLETIWKTRSYVSQNSAIIQIYTHTPLPNGLTDWRNLGNILGRVSGMAGYKILALSVEEAWLDISIQGSIETFSIALSRFGYHLSKKVGATDQANSSNLEEMIYELQPIRKSGS